MYPQDKDNVRVCEMIHSWVWSLRIPQSRGIELDVDIRGLQAQGWAKWKKGLWEPGPKEWAWELGG